MMRKQLIIGLVMLGLLIGCTSNKDSAAKENSQEQSTAEISASTAVSSNESKPVVQVTQQSQPQEVESMAGKKVLMIIAPVGFRDEEFLEPKAVFEKNKIAVTVASKGVAVAKGKLGATAKVDIDISKAKAADYDAVVFIGGPGASVYFNDPTAIKLATDTYSSGKVTAAICIAPSILANAGVLKGHKATAFESESVNIGTKSKGYTGEEVTVDGKVVTANGPAAATKFGNAIVALLR